MAWTEPARDKQQKLLGHRVRYRLDGKKSSPVYETKAEAKANLPRYNAIEDAHKPMTGSREHAMLPLSELVLRYLDYRMVKGKLLEEYYQERLKTFTRTIELGGWVNTHDVTVASIIDWRKKQRGSGARDGAYLRGLLRWARDALDQSVDSKALVELRPRSSPTKVIPRPKAAEMAAWKSEWELYGENVQALITCCMWQGWRPSMAARMKVEDYIPEDGAMILRHLKQQDGSSKRSLLFPEPNLRVRAITKDRGPKEWLFLDPRTGKGWTEGKYRARISHWWRRHVDNHVSKGVYNLKYDAMSYMSECGLSPQEIQAFTGHKDLRQVLTYLRTNEEQQRAAISKVLLGAKRGQVSPQHAITPDSESYKPLKIQDSPR